MNAKPVVPRHVAHQDIEEALHHYLEIDAVGEAGGSLVIASPFNSRGDGDARQPPELPDRISTAPIIVY